MYVCVLGTDEDDPVTIGETLKEAAERMATAVCEDLPWVIDNCNFYKLGHTLGISLKCEIVEN